MPTSLSTVVNIWHVLFHLIFLKNPTKQVLLSILHEAGERLTNLSGKVQQINGGSLELNVDLMAPNLDLLFSLSPPKKWPLDGKEREMVDPCYGLYSKALADQYHFKKPEAHYSNVIP